MSPGPEPALALATYNIHSCVGCDRRRDPGRITAVIEELSPDVIALQEVERGGRGSDLVEDLAARLGLEPLYGPTLLRSGAPYGNALLVDGTVHGFRRCDLSVPGRERRGAIDAEVEVQGRRLQVVTTHFGLARRERLAQAKRLAAELAPAPELPAVLLGDFNEWFPWARSLRVLSGQWTAAPACATFPARRPLLALDRVWSRGLDGARIRAQPHRSPLARCASDHLPVRAWLRLRP